MYQKILDRLSRGESRIIIYSKGGLRERLGAALNHDAPKDFYYGFIELLEKGFDVRIFSSSESYVVGINSYFYRVKEWLISRLTGISKRSHLLELDNHYFENAECVISFTDHFSLTLGNYFKGRNLKPVSIGLFHGLCHFENRVFTPFKGIANNYIKSSLDGLDYVGFFGPEDRNEAVRRYGLDENKTSIFRFGVDIDFWYDTKSDRFKSDIHNIVSVGSDPSRDYDTLVNANVDADINIVTSLSVDVPGSKDNIIVHQGDFYSHKLDDKGIRDLYSAADIIVVPLKDVYQPSGYSVTLQAMACGKPVILSRIKGLWTPELLINNENCILVEPENAAALTEAIQRLLTDTELRKKISLQARETVENEFSLTNMFSSLENLVGKKK